ncbi:MAG: PQQ-binding-like beta-propeller repeat protein [Methanofollis sp.]|uniref:outer membrane protein assembly factor BamB family protein n=1 Tax=Methanofollis sp. TaxID=2052835 RepID=UPI002611A846|nr:PQQ-binding-like beta-propeller repeat protein [Methanofollis sp.]MDD4254154.1 PQQ-binding-like beta-propeller repeat protein [Methanofollis sp.]
MRKDYSESGGRYLRWIAATFLLLFMIISIAPAAADSGTTVMPSNKDTLLSISNNENARFNDYGNNTYHFFNPAQSATQGLNAFHITTDASNSNGQVTFSGDQSGVFYITDTGGRGWDDDGILMLAINGTVPDDFRVHIKASGYRWTPVLTGTYPAFENVTYVPVALDETFTKNDFLYGPQIWRPCAAADYPIFDGQDMTDTGNIFSIMFIDLNAGILGANTLSRSDFSGQSITDNGAIKVEYSFENLETFAAFDGYAYTVSSNQGQGVRWTNRLSATGSSGYAVIGVPPVLTSINVTPATADVGIGTSMQFTATALDQNNRPMTGLTFAWSSSDETVGMVNETGYFTALAAGTTTITAANDTFEGTATVTVTAASPGPQPLPDYNYIFFTVANDAGVKYNAFGNNTYNVRFEGYDRGLNALHISTDPAVNFGQVTVSENQSSTFYATDSGGKGYEDEIILMVAVNGTIPDTFRLHVKADGYTWTPNPVSNQAPPLDTVTYQPSALDETFTKEDFRYGPQIWKPTGNGFDYPIYCGQDMSDAANTFQVMFIDLNAGVLRPNAALENRGAVRINYSFENLDTFVAFNVYGYCQNSNNGDNMVAWSNALLAPKVTSGYSVIGAGSGPTPSRIEVAPVTAALSVGDDQQFVATAYNADDNPMAGITVVWSSSNETVGAVNATGYFTALAAGTTNVTASYGAVSGSAAVTVTEQSGGLADSAWPMVGHDLRHTGQSPYTGPSDPMQKWSYTTGGFLTIQPVIDQNGTIYVGSRDKKLHAVNPDGTLKWSYLALNQIYTASAIGSDGTVYFGCRDAKIYAVNPDGTLKWTFTTGGVVSSAPTIGSDGTIYAGSAGTKIHAINPDGTEKWSYTTGGAVSSAPAIGSDGTIYAGSADMKIYALNPDGTQKWSYTTAGVVNTAPAIGADGTIYAGSADGSLYALNPDGTQKWSYATGGAVASPAIGSDGTIYVGSASKTVNAVNPDGTQKWSYTTTGTITEAPAVDAEGTVYIPSTDKNDRNLYVIGSDGTLKWTFLDPVSPRFFYAPSIGADGTIYVGSSDSKLYAITENTAPKLTTISLVPKNPTVLKGNGLSLNATAIDQYGNQMERSVFAWTSSNETVGTVNATGYFAAFTAGKTVVTASKSTVKGTTTITVHPDGPVTLYVDASGGGDFTTIQAAVDAAFDGDRIIVRDGTYVENVVLDRAVYLGSMNGSSSTIIRPADPNDNIVTIQSDNVTVEGFSLTGTDLTYSVGKWYVRNAVYSYECDNLTIAGNDVFDDYLGISIRMAHNSTITGNTIHDVFYRGIWLDGQASLWDNSVRGSSGNTISNNVLYNITGATDLFGPICVRYATDNTITGNEIHDSGDYGLSILSSESNIVSGNQFRNISVGGIEAYFATDNLFVSNTFTGGQYAMFIRRGGSNTAYLNTFNTPSAHGWIVNQPAASWQWNSTEPVTYMVHGEAQSSYLGNFWGSSFTCNDSNTNGIGDEPFVITTSSSTQIDNYPLCGSWKDGVILAPASIVLTPQTSSLTPGDVLTFSAAAYDDNGAEISPLAFGWTSSDATVGTVNATGYFTAHKIGTTTVSAAANGAVGTATVTVTPPHGDQTTDSSLDVPGCNMTTNGDGKQEVRVNTSAANATVSGNTIRLDEDTFSLIIKTEGAPTVVNGTVNGTIAGITLNTAPVTTVLDGVGTVTASVSANLTGIPSGAALQTTVSANVSADAQSAFQLAASSDGLKVNAVAYTMNIVKTNLTNGQDVSYATIRMTASPAWVDAHGGVGAVRIIRSAEDGTKEVLKTVLVGTDADGNMVFEAFSPKGLSIFGLAAVSTAPSGGETVSSHSSSGGGNSEVAAISGSIPAGETQTFVVRETAITRITVSAWDAIDDMLVTVQKASLPTGMDAPSQTPFEVIKTTLYRADPAAIDTVTLEFAVPTAWIKEHGLSADSIVLLSYEKGAWKPLKTSFLKEENGQALYSAEASGFSYFAIAAGKTASAGQQVGETVTPTVTETAETTAPATMPTTQKSPVPWFLSLVAIGVLFLLKRD